MPLGICKFEDTAPPLGPKRGIFDHKYTPFYLVLVEKAHIAGAFVRIRVLLCIIDGFWNSGATRLVNIFYFKILYNLF